MKYFHSVTLCALTLTLSFITLDVNAMLADIVHQTLNAVQSEIRLPKINHNYDVFFK